jgi:hypothetical protein
MITNQFYSVNPRKGYRRKKSVFADFLNGPLPFLVPGQRNDFLGSPKERFPFLQERLNSLPVIITDQARHLALGFHLQGRVQVAAQVFP